MYLDSLYTAAQCRELELLANTNGIAGYTLMCRAGAAALTLLLETWPAPAHIHVMCGAGNNGGDGLVLARLARQQGLPVSVHFLGDANHLRGEALQAWQEANVAGVPVQTLNTEFALQQGVIVDALLGIGVLGTVRDDVAAAINWMNNSTLPILAMDMPSGICADTGKILGVAVMATQTITFIAAKRGLYTGHAVDYTGLITVANLAVSDQWHLQIGAAVSLLAAENLPSLPTRPRTAHKGCFGHVLVIGGSVGMAGAALMAATAAARCGAGLVTVATLREHVPAYIANQPEIMAHSISNIHELQPLLAKATMVVIGPGLGQSRWAEQILFMARVSGLPLLLDADALNLIGRASTIQPPFVQPCVLTPHTGEAARLLATTTDNINADRFLAAQQLQQKYHATVVLKGAGTLIATTNGELALCPYGNPGMASGGMGDVLSGVIAGLAAQGLTLPDAAKLGVVLHAQAADILAQQHGQRGLLATDLIPVIRRLVNAA